MQRIQELILLVAKYRLLTQSSNCTIAAASWYDMWRNQDQLRLAWGSYRWEISNAVRREADLAKYWGRDLRLADVRRRLQESRGFRPHACRDWQGNYIIK